MRHYMALSLLVALCATLLIPQQAEASCSCFTREANPNDPPGSVPQGNLFNSATQVALMRDGTKTILSMQNNYQGPVKNFAMVVPVPVILQEADVKTLPADVFRRLDLLSAPRLVEYFEQDPCPPRPGNVQDQGSFQDSSAPFDPEEPPVVVVEAEFEVGEYNIAVLSATESSGLNTWLIDNNYAIPDGATPLFEQYIQQGMYFFVARIDPAKVTFDGTGNAVLSPLRFAYDDPNFSLPVRLGMVNSQGEQDLIVYILSREGRYEVANYPNALIPTNVLVRKNTVRQFGDFYTKLFADTLTTHPGAVITEYAWSEHVRDHTDPWSPSPINTPIRQDYLTLGADVLDGTDPTAPLWRGAWTLTRLHARYGKDEISDDLVFRKAGSISGGHGRPTPAGVLSREVTTLQGFESNTFQARYVILNPWEGELTCTTLNRGRWGNIHGRAGSAVSPNSGGIAKPSSANTLDDYFADLPLLPTENTAPQPEPEPVTPEPPDMSPPPDMSATPDMPGAPGTPGEEPDAGRRAEAREGELGGSSCATSPASPAGGALTLLGLLGALWMTRRRKHHT